MKRRAKLGLTLAIVFLAIALLYFFAPNYLAFVSYSQQNIDKKLKNFYELAIPNSNVEVVYKEEQHGLYKVLLKVVTPAGISYREAYVTKDGAIITEMPIFVDRAIQQITRSKNFVDCLFSKGVRIYGLSNQSQTLLQLNLLGIYASKLYVPCDGNLVQNCVAANVTQVPSIVINKSVYPGVKDINWLSQQTGCVY